jgi:hypothetical protein
MPVEGKNSPSISKGVLYDDNTLIVPPAIRLRIRHSAVTDAIDRLSEAGRTLSPVFAGMKSTKTISIPSIISPSQCRFAVRSVQWKVKKVKNIYKTAGCAGLPDRFTKKGFSQLS